MYWILAIMAAIAATIIALVVGGLVTPRRYRTSRRVTVQLHAPVVRALLEDTDGYERWVGAPLSITRNQSAPSVAIAPDILLDVTDDDTGAQRQWQWHLREAHNSTGAARTSIVLTESGDIPNPIVRFFASFRGHAGTVDRTLTALALHLGEREVSVERESSE